jgi:acyl transferase domain-containing protein/NAD(P)H-dependent flavin oxidoreductase YrpB (nitropropane dioxygenase family)
MTSAASVAGRGGADCAAAAMHAGACAILDADTAAEAPGLRRAIDELRRAAGKNRSWGIRLHAADGRTLKILSEQIHTPVAALVAAAIDFTAGGLPDLAAKLRPLARRILAEAHDLAEALAAEEAGFDGVVLVGREASGRDDGRSAFILLQQAHGRLQLPYWIRGGIGPNTAPAAVVSGAAGVVLCEQLWLADESSCSAAERRALSRPQFPLSYAQEILFAEPLARRHESVGRILNAFRTAMEVAGRHRYLARAERGCHWHPASAVGQIANLPQAAPRVLAADNELAQLLGVKYPIFQAPIPWLTDVAPFAEQVAQGGAVPFLAAGFLRHETLQERLGETAQRLAGRPWGVGLLDDLPEPLRREQLAALRVCPPRFAMLFGQRNADGAHTAQSLEAAGIATYCVAESPEDLDRLLARRCRKFILRGDESGGRTGPCTSFVLWQCAIDRLTEADLNDPGDVHVLLGGGIHDAISAAMAATVASPLASRGIKVGILLGTAYLFTDEAVASGAVPAAYQRWAVECRETTRLTSGPRHSIRSAKSPATERFEALRRERVAAGKQAEEIHAELELFQVGRLRMAAQRATTGAGTEVLADKEVESIATDGLFIMGEAATLREQILPIDELHAAVCLDGPRVLELVAEPRSPRLRRRVRTTRREPLAIVGLGCMFPQSPDARRFWQNIVNRFDAVQEVSGRRWRADDFFDQNRLKPDRFYSKWGAQLDEIVFDPFRYRVPPAALPSIEPIQLMALEVARQALEDAGYERPEFPRKRTAVIFATAGSHDLGMQYSFRTMLRHWLPRVPGLDEAERGRIIAELESRLPQWTEDSFAGFLLNVVPGRISNRFDLSGANFAVDAACASSLAALQTAAGQLRSRTCDVALVGAVDGTNNPFCFMSFAKTHALSPSGRSRPFDEQADGIGLGEGIAAVVVKRLGDAERDGDRIHAVIRGIGSSSDGMARSLTAPFPDGQLLAMRRAYQDAGVSPASVTLIESHGTGTAVGDRVEVEALGELFRGVGATPRGCAIGSIKSMIGHTKSVAGLASLVKTTLALEHRVLPPTIGVERPNEQLRSDASPFYVSAETRPWFNRRRSPRRAGVSAFGFGGTNFHVVLEEHRGTRIDLMPRAGEPLCWSRSSRDELLRDLKELDARLGDVPELDAATSPGDLAGLARAVHHDEAGRAAPPDDGAVCRLGIVAVSLAGLRTQIRTALAELPGKERFDHPSGIYYSQEPAAEEKQCCFLFPGQGSQSVNMLKDLALGSAWAFDLFDQADRELGEFFDRPLTDYIYPPPVFDDDARQQQQRQLNDTRIAQPALGLVELFGIELLARFGLRPGMVGGHSYGECVALCAAGVHAPHDLLRLSALRGRAVHEFGNTTPGGMATVFADGQKTAAAIAELDLRVRIANYNADVQTVVAGSVDAIEEAVAKLSKTGLRTRRIPVTAAFHTPAMSQVREVMDGHFGTFAFHEPALPVFSNTNGRPYPCEPTKIRHQLGDHLTGAVMFAQELHAMHEAGARIFVEVGPGGVMTSLVRRNLKDKPFEVVSLDGGERDGWLHLAHVLSRLSALGLPVTLDAWFERRRLPETTVAEFFRRLQVSTERKATDWIVGPAGARPVSANGQAAAVGQIANLTYPRQVSNLPHGTGNLPHGTGNLPHGTGNLPHGTGNLPGAPHFVEQPRMETHFMERQESAMETAATVMPGELCNAPCVLAQFQTAMTQWLEVQKGQQQAYERFLATQETIMLACLQGGAAAVAKRPGEERPVSQPAVVAAPRVAPSPVLPPKPVATAPLPPIIESSARMLQSAAQPPRPTMPSSNGHGAADAAAPAKAATQTDAAVVLSPSSNGVPTLETFRKDLLEAIADRTGYPIEMLDEKLELEAGLGIDSIKTIEIFGQLSQYHAYLPGANDDQDEGLARFAKLRTIRDILDSFEATAQQKRQQDPAGANGDGHAEEKPAVAVQRAVVQAVDAPWNAAGQKKNSREVTSS